MYTRSCQSFHEKQSRTRTNHTYTHAAACVYVWFVRVRDCFSWNDVMTCIQFPKRSSSQPREHVYIYKNTYSDTSKRFEIRSSMQSWAILHILFWCTWFWYILYFCMCFIWFGNKYKQTNKQTASKIHTCFLKGWKIKKEEECFRIACFILYYTIRLN